MRVIYVSQNANTGYALSAKQYILALLDLGVEVQWQPTQWTRNGAVPIDSCPHHPELHGLLRKIKDPDRVLLHLVPTEHSSLLPMNMAPTVSYTTWETDRLPSSFLPPLQATKAVMVPCSWNKEVFQKSGLSVPVHVVPHLLDRSLEEFQPQFTSDPFTFYSIGPWTDRKALGLVVESFCTAFSHKDKVRLVLKTTSKDCTRHSDIWALRHLLDRWNTSRRAVRRIRSKFSNPPPVELVCRDLSREEILQFHRSFHCFVLLSRGEGWGLGGFEAAAAGVPVIATNFGGPLDYLDPQYAYMVNFELSSCRVASWEALFTHDQSWAEPDVDHAAELMRLVFDNFEQARERAAAQAKQIRKQFHREIWAPKLLTVLDTV